MAGMESERAAGARGADGDAAGSPADPGVDVAGSAAPGESVATRGARGPAPAKHLVITVHGIRTAGDWQALLEKMLKEDRSEAIEVVPYKYNYFSALAFLFPLLRWIAARRFRARLLSELEKHPDARVDIVAHSFGTYLVGQAIRSIPRPRGIHTIILAGSVLKPSFPWHLYARAGQVGRVVNECGIKDSILVLSQGFVLGMGMAGRVGFIGLMDEQLVNRYHPFGHSGYFLHDGHLCGDFMRARWLPLLTGAAPPARMDARRPLNPVRGAIEFLLNNAEFLKIAAAVLVLTLIYMIPMAAYRQKVALDKVRRFSQLNRLAMLTAEVPERNSADVAEWLKPDLPGLSPDLAIGVQGIAPPSDWSDPSDPDPSAKGAPGPRWWNRIPGLRDLEIEVDQAVDLHTRAIALRAAKEKGGRADPAQARLLFQQALEKYEPVREQVRGSYALCLLDYGLTLTALGEYPAAIAQFQKVHTRAFPNPEAADRDPVPAPGVLGLFPWGGRVPGTTSPRSLRVESLCQEAEAHKLAEQWDQAKRCLIDAISCASTPSEEPKLLARISSFQGWFSMERNEVREARSHFERAHAYCKGLLAADPEDFNLKVTSYWIRHGLALTKRFERDGGDEALEDFGILCDEIRTALRDDTLLPKQRKDLHIRYANSLERRADCQFFNFYRRRAARPYILDLAVVPGEEATPPDPSGDAEPGAGPLLDAACKTVPADDPSSRLRVLYKQYIAAFMENPNPPDRDAASSHVWDEAERIYEGFSPPQRRAYDIYRQIALACAGFRQDPRQGESRERGANPRKDEGREWIMQGLREFIKDLARNRPRLGKLKREHVEMLLLGSEILLDTRVLGSISPGWRADPVLQARRRADAQTLNELLTSTTGLSEHSELGHYASHFINVAAVVWASTPKAKGIPGPPDRPAVPTNRSRDAGGIAGRRRLTISIGEFPIFSVAITREASPPPLGPVAAPEHRSPRDSPRAGGIRHGSAPPNDEGPGIAGGELASQRLREEK
jgi:tetratricopeptide (TPR) repeat protein